MAFLNEQDFKKQISSGELPPLCLVFGDEDYLKSFAVKQARELICPDPTFAFFNEIRLDAMDFDAQKLIDALMPLPMMADKTFVWIDDVDVFIWGSPEGIIDFREETMTEDFGYWHIMPNKAIEITYGRFPIFIMIKEKDIIKVGDFRSIF